MSDQLLLTIARCPEIAAALRDPSHDCHRIVAAPRCSTDWLGKVIEASPTPVIVALGRNAKEAVRRLVPDVGAGAYLMRDGRHFLFLGAPGSNHPRRLARCIPDPGIREAIRQAAISRRTVDQ